MGAKPKAKPQTFEKYFVIEPEVLFCKSDNFKEGKSLPDDFKYSSDTNKEWFSKEEMKRILENLEIESS